MKILFLSHTFPFPLDEGTRVLVYNLLRGLSGRNEVHLICTNDRAVTAADRAAVARLGVRSVQVFEHEVPKALSARVRNVFLDRVPFCVRQFESQPMREAIERFLGQQGADVIHAEYISSAAYRESFGATPAVFYPHDAVSMLFERNIGAERGLRKFYTRAQWRKVIDFERREMPRFAANVIVSPVDREYLMRHVSGARIEVIPLGIDADFFSARPAEEKPDTVLFRGVMGFLPNADAARFFYREIFQRVKAELPGARFVVAGANPPPDLQAWAAADPALSVTGFVEDMRAPMSEASVIVCPMRIGSGIKIKLLESLAMGKAVVATPLACAGLELRADEHLLVAEAPEQFARCVAQLLRDPKRRAQLGEAGRRWVRERYTWDEVCRRFEEVYRKAMSHGKN